MKRPLCLPLLVILGALCPVVGAASPVTIDGTVEPAYGPALSTQTTQTSRADNPPGWPDSVAHARGSELDQAFGFISDGVLHLFLAGNLLGYFNIEFYPQDYLQVFIDSNPGGQNRLRSDNPGLGFYPNALGFLAGLTFDTGFEPDYWLNCTVWSNDPPVYAYYAELPAGGGGSGYFLGRAAAGGPGTLSGGTNPNGILATVNNSNTAGVTYGCGAASGAGVMTGVEWAIPLAAIGTPTGCIKVCAFENVADPWNAGISNQVLGPLPPGTCYLGDPGGVDFASIPGDQYFTICPSVTPARTATWGRLKVLYR